MDKVRVAIIGVGNCASSLVQGVQFYRDARAEEFVPGLMHALAACLSRLIADARLRQCLGLMPPCRRAGTA